MLRDILTWRKDINVGVLEHDFQDLYRFQLWDTIFLKDFGPWKMGVRVSLLEIDFMEGTMTGPVEGRDGLVTWHWFMTACDDG